jgi:anti-sigma regulatory factor (Ser/Thr protein kinase)
VLRQSSVVVVESSQVGEARRVALRFAEAAGLKETAQGKVGIDATELANNLVRHAQGGQLLIQIMPTERGNTVELLSIDTGPGISDVERCLQDGFSTGGTSGNGLGAIKRLSAEFDIHSTLSVGTTIVARIADENPRAVPPASFLIGAVSIAMPGEVVCGDGWKCSPSEHALRMMVVDGLGHGLLAEAASNAAERVFDDFPAAEPKAFVAAAHAGLTGTRGAAIAAAHLDIRSHRMSYAGVGNIAGSHVTIDGSQGLVSHNGIVGIRMQKVQQFDYPFDGHGLVIMHSDGLRSRWTLSTHPGLFARHPALIAAVLYRDYRRGRDDATVVVARLTNGKA